MCGIVGYIGNKPVYDILINGLKKLEYRGYDSAGIMLYDKTSVIKKSKGKVADLESLFTNKEDKKGSIQDGLLMDHQIKLILIHMYRTQGKFHLYITALLRTIIL